MNQPNPLRLFTASRMALVATAMTFAIRANLIGKLGAEFAISSENMGIVVGTAFWGFTLSILIGGPLCDILGMRKLIYFAFIGHISGVLLTIFSTGFFSLFVSTLLIGIANGLVEAACNPLIATLYKDEKTKRLNQFHLWFPGGIVLGGLSAYFLEQLGLGWQLQLALILIPSIGYGLLFLNQEFPATERQSSGISMKEMVAECATPLFIFMVFCMFLTAATELGTNQWVAELLGNAGIPSILLLVLINGLMALGRAFAGPVEKLLSPAGILLASAVLSSAGLYLLSQSSGYMLFASAIVFAAGICYFWPTMLGFVSEYLPRTGELGLSIMGGAGMLSVAFILPYMGGFYDIQTVANLPEGASLAELKDFPKGTPEFLMLAKARLIAGASTLKYISLLPFFLIFAFWWLFQYMRKRTSSYSLLQKD
jgi:MFS family permease